MRNRYKVTGIAFLRGSDIVRDLSYVGYTYAESADKAVNNIQFRDKITLRDAKTEIVPEPPKTFEQLRLF